MRYNTVLGSNNAVYSFLMKNKIIRKILSLGIFLFGLSFIFASQAYASGSCVNAIDGFRYENTVNLMNSDLIVTSGSDKLEIEMYVGNKLDPRGTYHLLICALNTPIPGVINQCINEEARSNTVNIGADGVLRFTITDREALSSNGATLTDNHYVFLMREDTDENICFAGEYVTDDSVGTCDSMFLSQERIGPTGSTETCKGTCWEKDVPITITANGLKDKTGAPYNGPVTFVLGEDGWFQIEGEKSGTAVNGTATASFTPDGRNGFNVGVKKANTFNNFFRGCQISNFRTKDFCAPDSCSANPVDISDGSNIEMFARQYELCSQITNTELRGKCDECYQDSEGVWTAVGCIERTPQSIVKSFLEIGLGVGGGICLLMCLTAGFMLTTSQGDPKQVTEAREMITSAIIGLLFIIFSVFILQFIGVTIFNIPGFGAAPTVTP